MNILTGRPTEFEFVTSEPQERRSSVRHIIVVWSKSDDSAFESHVPLLFNAERNRRLGSTCKFDVVFLEGLNLFSEGYRERLSSLGFSLHDAERSYQKLKVKYSHLARFGDYECKCLLRWLVISEFFGNDRFVHYDADLIFNATPEELENDLHGLTFMLQGCPAYLRAEDPAWIESYTRELDRFVADVEGYSEEAWSQRPKYLSIVRASNSALWNRRILSSDQDLLQFLTLSGRIPQADAETVAKHCSTALFQNVLTIGDDIHIPLPLKYKRTCGVDYVGGRKVAFWHMQSDFCDYLAYASFRDRFWGKGRVPWNRNSRTLNYRAYKRFFPRLTRRQLLRKYFENNQNLSFLLNEDRFWQPGVFS